MLWDLSHYAIGRVKKSLARDGCVCNSSRKSPRRRRSLFRVFCDIALVIRAHFFRDFDRSHADETWNHVAMSYPCCLSCSPRRGLITDFSEIRKSNMETNCRLCESPRQEEKRGRWKGVLRETKIKSRGSHTHTHTAAIRNRKDLISSTSYARAYDNTDRIRANIQLRSMLLMTLTKIDFSRVGAIIITTIIIIVSNVRVFIYAIIVVDSRDLVSTVMFPQQTRRAQSADTHLDSIAFRAAQFSSLSLRRRISRIEVFSIGRRGKWRTRGTNRRFVTERKNTAVCQTCAKIARMVTERIGEISHGDLISDVALGGKILPLSHEFR